MNAPRPAWLEGFPSAEVRALDPRLHTLIEASAGTGKTFAVEHLVLRLLMENPEWMPEDILLLSFTEKTAADLRARIRALLHRQARPGQGPEAAIPGWSDEDRARLRLLWMHADDLAVHTLHAFCQSSLRRDPLASDVLIRDEVADDRALADAALENLLRGPWAKDPERLGRLRDALGIDGGDGWRRKVIGPALNWHPWRGDRLDPEPGPERAPSLEVEIEDACGCLRDALARVDAGTLPLAEYFARLPDSKREGNAFFRAHRLVAVGGGSRILLGAFTTTFYGKFTLGEDKAGKTKAYKDGFASLLESTRGRDIASLAEWSGLAAACDGALRMALRVEHEAALDRLRLRAQAVREVREELAREKRKRGVISYDDMPANLVAALRRDPDLAARIRRRYKACIVDEFQDTDPVQWEILERLCLNAPAESPPLFLVGDPKQAIYGFRGGDLRTYLAARGAFRDMAADGRAQGFGLDANFRSRRALIEALNAVFARPEWFGAPPDSPADPAWRLPAGSGDVAFTPARAGRPDPEQAPRVFLRDFAESGEATGPAPRKGDIERAVRHWIAARVVRALKDGRRPEEIAVLVRRNAEGEALERLLRRRGVPCRARRRGGVYHGAAADALRMLLEWIDDVADPDVQARILLLPFARSGDDALPQGRPTRCPPLLAAWAELAREGRWPEFFDAVHRQGGYRDRLATTSPSEAERFERLIRLLSEAGAAPRTTARALCARFDALRRGEDEGAEGGNAGPGETPGGEVSILTLHLSKGLEFPVVFIAAVGEGAGSDHFVLRPPGEKGFRIALDAKDPASIAAHALQEHGEEKRLFYVAFTRAKDELHVPLLPAAFARNGKPGPLGGFAGDALRAAAAASPHLFRADAAPIDEACHEHPTPEAATAPRPADRARLLAEARAAFERRRNLASYSGLARRAVAAAPTAPAPAAPQPPEAPEELLEDSGARMRREETVTTLTSDFETEDAPHPREAPSWEHAISAEELPPGAESGTALHALLEHTVFASAAETGSPEEWFAHPGRKEFFEERLKRESVAPAHAFHAARAVWNTLRMPLPDPAGGPDFRLSDLVDPSDYRHEVEFLLPFAEEPASPPPEGVSRRGNFLWGFIDLVFRREGRYYLLDWKSNLLPAYDPASVRESMTAHRYDLQWKLYSVVLDRWLAARLPGYDPAAHFGGVHYLYLRGASPARFSGFATRPTSGELREDFPAEIRRALGAPIRPGEAS